MRLVDFFFALRPLVLVPAWSFFVLGAAAAQALQPFPGSRFVALSLVLCGGYLVNQIVDFESDRRNGKGLFLQRGLFTRRTYATAAVLAVAAGLLLAWRTRQTPLGIALAAALVLAYSVPPLRLSARAGWDLAANAVGYGGLAPWIGAGGGPLRPEFWIATSLAVGAVFVHTTLLDTAGDRATGKHTLGVALSPRAARGLALLLSLPAPVLLRGAGWPAAAAAGLTALLCAAATRGRCPSRTVCVGATAAFAAAAALAWWPFGPALLLLVLATRVYYRRRFGLAYPAA